MGAKHWIIFVAIVAVIIGGMVYMSVQSRLDISDISKEQATGILDGEDRSGGIGDHFMGNRDAKVVLIEYGDFQCPGCRTASVTANAVAEKYKDYIAFVFRNYPLTSMHSNARAAAASVEAAGLQGKYWKMHDMVFAAQDTWSSADVSQRNDIFVSYAEQLGLDIEKFKQDTASEQVTKKIDFDVAIGKKFDVTGTPAFYIGEKKINSQTSDTALEDAVKEALKEAGVEVKIDEDTAENSEQ